MQIVYLFIWQVQIAYRRIQCGCRSFICLSSSCRSFIGASSVDAYLRPQTVVLRLSSEKVTDEEKAEMAAKMRGLESPEEYEEENVVITRTTRLPDLVSDQLWLVFPN